MYTLISFHHVQITFPSLSPCQLSCCHRCSHSSRAQLFINPSSSSSFSSLAPASPCNVHLGPNESLSVLFPERPRALHFRAVSSARKNVYTHPVPFHLRYHQPFPAIPSILGLSFLFCRRAVTRVSPNYCRFRTQMQKPYY